MPPAAQAAHDVDDQPISSAEMAGRGDDAKAIVGTEPPAAAVSDSEDASAQGQFLRRATHRRVMQVVRCYCRCFSRSVLFHSL